MSSQAGFVALRGESIYCLTKAAIVHLTRCLAVEWGDRGITVNAVAPTFIAPDGTAESLADAAFAHDVQERIAALTGSVSPSTSRGRSSFSHRLPPR